jgi:hypothetical protein
MKTDASGGGFLYAPPEQDLRQLTALAITDEPKGGSVSARGHKLCSELSTKSASQCGQNSRSTG